MSVSASRSRGGPNPWDIAAIAADHDKFTKRMAELSDATAKNLQSIKAVGQVNEMSGLFAEAKDDRAKARSTVQGANTRAKGILVKAEEKAAGLLSAAKGDNDALKAANRRAREIIKQREDTFNALEDGVASREEDYANRLRTLERRESEAARLKSSYESRMGRLKAAIKEAKL